MLWYKRIYIEIYKFGFHGWLDRDSPLETSVVNLGNN